MQQPIVGSTRTQTLTRTSSCGLVLYRYLHCGRGGASASHRDVMLRCALASTYTITIPCYACTQMLKGHVSAYNIKWYNVEQGL